MPCKTHPNRQETSYCKVCLKAICSDCQKTSCRDHQIVSMQKVWGATLNKDYLENTIRRVQEKAHHSEGHLNDVITNVTSLMTVAERRKDDAREKIEEQYRTATEQLEREKKELFKKIENQYEVYTGNLRSVWEQCDEEMKEAEAMINITRQEGLSQHDTFKLLRWQPPEEKGVNTDPHVLRTMLEVEYRPSFNPKWCLLGDVKCGMKDQGKTVRSTFVTIDDSVCGHKLRHLVTLKDTKGSGKIHSCREELLLCNEEQGKIQSFNVRRLRVTDEIALPKGCRPNQALAVDDGYVVLDKEKGEFITFNTAWQQQMVVSACPNIRSMAHAGSGELLLLCATHSAVHWYDLSTGHQINAVPLDGFKSPWDIAVCQENTIIVTDVEAHRIVRLDKEGRQQDVPVVFAGQPLESPSGVLADSRGSLLLLGFRAGCHVTYVSLESTAVTTVSEGLGTYGCWLAMLDSDRLALKLCDGSVKIYEFELV